jgi:C4-dicarboxylate-specific signal transduction histidine kinase
MKPSKTIIAAALAAFTLGGSASALELTPAMQKDLARQTESVKALAANPAVVKAVLDQNEKGPIPGMTNEKWKSVRRTDDLVKGLVKNEAAKALAQKIQASDGVLVRAFLSAAKGEKVAFTEKTISYIHEGQPKFDVPFSTGKTWQGPVELDTVTQTHGVQIAAPVTSGGKPVGVLVVGVNLAKLSK